MHWKDVKFELENHGNKLILKGAVFCGCILFIYPHGISRAASVSKALGFDLDIGGKIKVFKGSSAEDRLLGHYDMISNATMDDRVFMLWINSDAEQLVVNTLGRNLLLIDKTGLYRFGGAGGIGLPVDEQGRLRILRA